jgi:hypothetical protein
MWNDNPSGEDPCHAGTILKGSSERRMSSEDAQDRVLYWTEVLAPTGKPKGVMLVTDGVGGKHTRYAGVLPPVKKGLGGIPERLSLWAGSDDELG